MTWITKQKEILKTIVSSREKRKKILPVGVTTCFVIKCSLGLHWVRIQIKCCFKLDQSIFYLINPSLLRKLNLFTYSQKVNSAEQKNRYKNKICLLDVQKKLNSWTIQPSKTCGLDIYWVKTGGGNII